MTKVHYVVLTLSVSALLLWQLIELVDRERLLLHMRNTIVDTIITNFNEDKLSTNTVHDRKYGYFLQITDTHIDDHYAEGATLKSGCHTLPTKHKDSVPQKLCGAMGVPGVRMDAPIVLIEHTLNWIRKEWRDKLDFVIWTGDNSRHDWDITHPRKETKVLELNRKVTEMMTDLFSSSPEHPRTIPVVPVIGNNDVQPHNYVDLNDDVLFFFERLWKHWIPKSQRRNFLKGGYFSVDVAPRLRVLSVNTMFFLKKNPLAKSCNKRSSSGHTHMKWYKEELRRARRDKFKVYVIGHVPPSPTDFYKSCLSEYMSITASFPDIVYGHFYGHLNMDHFLLFDKREEELRASLGISEENDRSQFGLTPRPRISEQDTQGQDDKVAIQRNLSKYIAWLKNMYDDIDEFENKYPDRHKDQKTIHKHSYEPVVVVHVAPSVFPVYMPSVRIYRYEYRENEKERQADQYGTLLGYSQYVANITKYNEFDSQKNPRPPLKYNLEYDTHELYGLQNLSVDSYIDFADQLTQTDDKSRNLWSVYCNNILLQTLNGTCEN